MSGLFLVIPLAAILLLAVVAIYVDRKEEAAAREALRQSLRSKAARDADDLDDLTDWADWDVPNDWRFPR